MPGSKTLIVLLRKGLINTREAQSLVLVVIDLVQKATDDSKSVGIADTLCGGTSKRSPIA